MGAPYQALYRWEGREKEEAKCGFLLQYEETDWEFLRRIVSRQGCGVMPEGRFPGLGIHIGEPGSLVEKKLTAECYQIRSRIPGSVREDGTLWSGEEYCLEDQYETLYPGERVWFAGKRLVVASKEGELWKGVMKYRYILRPEGSSQVEEIRNDGMIGASIEGRVLESSPEASRLSLSTDLEGEAAESWHRRPVFYAGGGMGYSGRPEEGDTLYLYFPTEKEEERTVIGGLGAGYETLQAMTQKILDDMEGEEAIRAQGSGGEGEKTDEETKTKQPKKKADAATMPGYKSWSTPKNQGVCLSSAGVRFQAGGGSALNLSEGGIRCRSTGEVSLKGNKGIRVTMLEGKEIHLTAKEYLCLQCGMSQVALLPEEIHISGTEVHLASPLNEERKGILKEEKAEELKALYYEQKWGSPLQQFMPDGTLIGRAHGLEKNKALRRYFDEKVLGTEGYEEFRYDPMSMDGTLDMETYQRYHENRQYHRWLTKTYGKTKLEKVGGLSAHEGGEA